MNRDEIVRELRREIGEERLEHSLGVEKTASMLAHLHGCDAEKAALAGLLHDCAKGLPEDALRETASREGPGPDPEELMEPGLLHARVGAIMASESYGVDDPEVLRAIALHTTGDCGMTCLDKVVYLADAIEPGREYPGLDDLRELSRRSLDDAVLQLQERTIIKLLKKRAVIHGRTVAARNDLLHHLKHGYGAYDA